MRKFLSRSFWVAICLVFATVFWGLWYVSHRGFSHKWRQAVISELEKRGVHLTVGRLTVNPLQGLVAKDVRIRTSRQHGRAMAYINEVILDINYSNLVHGELFLNAVELHNATLSLPLDSPDAARKSDPLEISRINARVLLPPHQVTLEHAEAEVRGLRLTASGNFVNPEDLQSLLNTQSDSRERPLTSLTKALETLDELKMVGGNPSLEIRFSGDLAKPAGLFVETVFRSTAFRIGDSCRIESVQLTATLVDGSVRIDQCAIKDKHGTLDASGTFQIETGEAAFHLRSTLHLPDLIQAIHPASALNELVLYAPPLLEISGAAQFSDPATRHLKLTGRLSVGRFAVRSLIFEGAGTDFSWDGSGFSTDRASWYIHNTLIQHKDGNFVLNAMQVPGDFRINLDSHINPAVFLPLLPSEARSRLAEWEFRTAPLLHLEGKGPSCDPQTVVVNGKAQLGATRARGTALNSATVDIGFQANVLTCQNIKLERTEGIGTGTVVYDFNTDELQFLNVRTTLNPFEVVRIFDHDVSEQLIPYRFKARPSLIVNGKVGCRHDDWQRNRLRVEVDGARGMDYTFLKKELSTSKISGTVSIIGDRLKLDGLNATLWGGRLRGKADISLRKEQGDYTAELFTEEIDFPSLTKLYFDFDTSKGKLNGSFAFSGQHDFVRAINGTGKLNVTDGNVFAIPIFGPFSGILEGIIPGTGYNDARKGVCTFSMRDGVVTTEDLVMEGKGFSILGQGKLYVAEDKMDFTARINAQGFAGKVLSPVSHLLEYVSDGSLSKPVWRPKRLPNISNLPSLPSIPGLQKAIFSPWSQANPSPTPSANPSPTPLGVSQKL